MNTTATVLAKLVAPCGLALTVIASGAQAKPYHVIHTFLGQLNGDGASPWAALITDSAGNLYGTTIVGGANNEGTVFKLAPDGTETVLYNFCSVGKCHDGQWPHDGLITDNAGNLYGTATYGGDASGQGIVFEVTPDGKEKILYQFAGSTGDGAYPYGGLLADTSGNFYGTTVAGGPDNDGTIFKLTPDGTETVLYSFTNAPMNGNGPLGSLVADKHGNLYGTTPIGGTDGLGIVFRLTPDGKETVLHTFTGRPNDGTHPNPILIMDKAGNLYGTAYGGGANNDGVVFELARDRTETILHSFTGADGINPSGGLVMDKMGNLYGSTFWGGANSDGASFKLAPNGTVTVLHSFCQDKNCKDGGWPQAGLMLDNAGNLYGTTSLGGDYNLGTVFEVTP